MTTKEMGRCKKGQKKPKSQKIKNEIETAERKKRKERNI
jgi:hypothetical protein